MQFVPRPRFLPLIPFVLSSILIQFQLRSP